MIQSPCKNCKMRSTTCHIYCADYKAYVAEYERQKAEKAKQHPADAFIAENASKTKNKVILFKKHDRDK